MELSVEELAPCRRESGASRFTSDGRGLIYLAFEESRFHQEFWYLDLDSGQSRQLTDLDLRGTIRTLDITPDGKHIVFDRVETNSDVMVIRFRDP